MKWLKILTVTLGLVVSTVFALYAYMGGFRSVEVTNATYGPAEVVFGTHQGPYSGIAASWDRLYAEVKSNGLQNCDALAFYLDPPGTPETKLRSVLACRIDGLDAKLQVKLRKALPTFRVPAANSLHSSFPFRNFVSYMLGPRKVYPAMHRHLKAKSARPLVAIEVYGPQPTRGSVKFYMPLDGNRARYEPLFAAFKKK